VSDLHDHDHDHEHDDGGHHPHPPTHVEARTRALESLLIEKGLVSSEDVDRLITMYEQDIGPLVGARVVAHAWVDPDFKQRLLTDANAALRELGIESAGSAGTRLRVLENTPSVHNMVVCTLCSCYPWAILGLPPTWYKSAPYRSRAVVEPRAVLREFGLELPHETSINVWDSSSDLRYMVLPERPAGTEGWTEEQLVELVTRDSMIGVAQARVPAAA
jgi:nitrile hydratase subunit alpha